MQEMVKFVLICNRFISLKTDDFHSQESERSHKANKAHKKVHGQLATPSSEDSNLRDQLHADINRRGVRDLKLSQIFGVDTKQ